MRVFSFIVAAGLLVGGLVASSSVAQEEVSLGTGATLRALDKMNAETTDLTLQNGQTIRYGSLQITLKECRYPVGNPSGDGFAYLTVDDMAKDGDPMIFQGWMVASSPALNAMDHIRYDLWVLGCEVPAGTTAPIVPQVDLGTETPAPTDEQNFD